jgi:hypothetical protein
MLNMVFLFLLTPTGTSGLSAGAAAALELEGGPTYGVAFELDAEDDILIPLDFAPTGTTDLSLLDITAAAAADDDAAACLPLTLLLPLTTPPSVIEFTGPAMSSLLLLLLGFLTDADLGTETFVPSSGDWVLAGGAFLISSTIGILGVGGSSGFALCLGIFLGG